MTVPLERKYMLRQAVLLGNEGTKRTDYFRQAAEQAKLPVLFADWKDFGTFQEKLVQGEWIVKIDPPLWDSCSLARLEPLALDYRQKLQELSGLAKYRTVEFLNDPCAIWELLDKRACKRRLQQAGVPVTEMLEGTRDAGLAKDGWQENARIQNTQQLLERMRQTGMHQVFIKPAYGSGAAGVSAFRCQPRTGRMALYTCAMVHPKHGFVNTKCLRQFHRQQEVIPLLDRILALDCVVERWYAKASFQGHPYDLRAVVLDGRVEFLLGRLSKGPITNLHLNNCPVEAAALGIPERAMEEIAKVCQTSMACFAGLRCAGIDILLEKGSMCPKVIEMNAQGDLIYQDIFQENRIYRRQVQMMRHG